jgi:hypothetical protein
MSPRSAGGFGAGSFSLASRSPGVARRLAAEAIDRPVARHGGDPAAGVGRHAVDRPPVGGDRERIGDRVLGLIDVAHSRTSEAVHRPTSRR